MSVLVEVTTIIEAAPATVFDLELDVDEHAASQASSNEIATTSSGRRTLGLGDDVTFEARHLGLTWTLTSRVTEHTRPSRFVDEQVRGPFRTMRHEHLFDDLGDGRTRMTDRMTVAFVAGPVGALVDRVVTGPYLRRLLRRRARHVKQVAEARPA